MVQGRDRRQGGGGGAREVHHGVCEGPRGGGGQWRLLRHEQDKG